MRKKGNEKQENRLLKLEGSLSIYDVGTIREKLKESLTETEVLEIDMAEIKEFDTAVLQILCSAKKTAELMHKRLIFDHVPKAVEEVMIKTGITHEMISSDGGTGCQRQ